MKRLVCAVSVAAVVLMTGASSPAVAQDGELENEFSAFKKANQAAKQAPKEDEAAPEKSDDATAVEAEKPAAEDPLAAFRNGGDKATGAAGANPLGPAANLPVNGQMPTTGFAMTPQSPEEVQAQMEAEMEAAKRKMRDEAFRNALDLLMPLTPEEVRTTLGKFKESRQAAETPIAIPEPKIRVESISLDPTAEPLVIRLSPGYVSTVSILDSTGMPWAIQDLSWAGKIEVDTPESGGHVIRLTPGSAHGSGNLSLRLVDLITPVTFRFEIGLDEVDYRFDARLPKQGPLAKTPLIEYGGIKTVAGTNENITAVLDGTLTPGDDVKKLKLEGVDGRTTAWRIEDTVYLRTPLTLLSPAWNESASSGDGMNVYTLSDTPVILLSDSGKMVKARVSAEDGL